jgi:hypothetical protein
LQSQSSSIEELVLNLVPLKTVETILGKMKNLRKLRINSGSIPTDKEFYDFLKPLKTLREVEMHDEFLHEDAMKNFLGFCPNLESLKSIHDQSGIVSNCLRFIAVYNPRITTLMINCLIPQEEPEAQFKYLKAFHVETVDNLDVFLKFLRENSSIETLSIGNVDREELTDVILEKLMNETKIRRLKFAGDFDTIEGIYDKIKIDYKNLKSLELTLLVQGKRGQTLTFIFPSDKSMWNPKCAFFD